MDISTEFFSPAINWQKHTAYDGSVRELPDQWHLTVKSEPAKAMRFLSVIQITPSGSDSLPVEWNEGGATVGDWRITSELDVFGPAGQVCSPEDSGVQVIEPFISR